MELVQMTIGQMLRETVAKWPERPALQNSEQLISWRECLSRVESLASGLLTIGIKKGAHVGLLVPNTVEAFLLMLACWDIGAVTVLLNTSLSADELTPLLDLTEVEAIVSGGQHKNIVLMDTVKEALSGRECIPVVDIYSADMEKLMLAPNTALREAEEMVSPDDNAAILFTSGTTAQPKAVPSTHYMRVNNARIQARDQMATEHDKFCVAIPLFHCFCLTANLLAAVAAGACLCFPKSNRTAELMQTIETKRCTVLTCVPTLYFAMMAREDFASYDISCLRTGLIGGAAYTAEQFVKIEKAFKFRLLSSLGQTEATAGLTVCNYDDPLEVRSATVGHFMEHLEGCIMDSNEKPVAEGVQGEICVRGYSVMDGYYRSPEQTASTIDQNGWLHTGDMGYLDTDGNIHLTGRLKDLVIRGGENIAPAEIELCLSSECSEIALIKVVGVPDSHYGEELCAFVQLKPNTQLTEQQLRETAKEHLAYYKVPKYILFTENMPTTASGKIRGSQVREECVRILTEQGSLPC